METTNATAISTEPAVVSVSDEQRQHALDVLVAELGSEAAAAQAIAQARAFARRVHGDQIDTLASQPDSTWGAAGNAPDHVRAYAEAADEINAAEAVLGRDVLAMDSAELNRAIHKLRAEHGPALLRRGLPESERLHAALSGLHRAHAARLSAERRATK